MKYIASAYNIVVEETEDSVYLYNSYTGALAKLEKEIYKDIENSVIDEKDPCRYFKELVKQGFLKPSELNEYNKLLMAEKGAIYESTASSLTFVIAPTLACNLNCVYCFENGFRSNKYMTDETLAGVIEYIKGRINKHISRIHITWFGGEPLLAYNTIVNFNKKFLKLIEDKKIKYTSSMITNGTLLTEDKASYLSKFCAVKNVQITIDGSEEIYCRQKGATPQQFYQVLKNIKLAIQYLNVSVRFNCNKNNYNDIIVISEQIIKYCGSNKNLHFYLAKLVDYNCSCNADFYSQEEFDIKSIEFEQQIEKLLNKEYKPQIPKYKKNFCGLYKLKNLVIGPDGEFYKCEHYVGQTDKIVGNIKQNIFYTNEMLEFIDNPKYEKCSDCKLFPLCIGGCPAQKRDLQNTEACALSLEYIKNILKSYIRQNKKS